jgi:hypothetical protein
MHIINGTESSASSGSAFAHTITLHANLVLSGRQKGTKITSEPG